MDIKYKLVLNCMTWEAADKIEKNTIGEFKARNSNAPGYYIVQWTGNVYTLQKQYTSHAFNTPVIIYKGELVFTANVWTPLSKSSYWNHDPDEAIPVIVKLKQVVIPHI